MPSKKKILIPQPRSKFLRVRCKCGNEQIIFDRCSIRVICNVCGEVLAEPTGGKSKIYGEIIEELT
ncbi:MAG: 30S ribosomal protein S27e [Candidatus Asgardarchaeum sp.]|nr:30S ribosomal protein S27e [Candidatus Odinarchaeota archaeon]